MVEKSFTEVVSPFVILKSIWSYIYKKHVFRLVTVLPYLHIKFALLDIHMFIQIRSNSVILQNYGMDIRFSDVSALRAVSFYV